MLAKQLLSHSRNIQGNDVGVDAWLFSRYHMLILVSRISVFTTTSNGYRCWYLDQYLVRCASCLLLNLDIIFCTIDSYSLHK